MPGYTLISVGLVILAVVIASYFRVSRVLDGAGPKAHSRPVYHLLNAAVWTGVPALFFFLLWLFLKGAILDSLVLSGIPGADLMSAAERNLLLSEISQLASGVQFKEPGQDIVGAVERYNRLQAIAELLLFVACLSIAAIGAFLGYRAISRRFAARHSFERAVTLFMVASSAIAIVTTAGIAVSLAYEAWSFFSLVPLHEFLFGTRWEPQIAIRADQVAGQGAFGMVPVLFGTVVISLLAMLVAVPIGVMSAIYLAEYSSPRFRAVAKPLLEILAGIPTVVYGFFAVLTVAPLVRTLGLSLGVNAAPNSSLAAGLVMGIMIIPFVSSISDDALASVPGSMRDGSYALGATRGETIRKVLLQAALPGIVSGILLALSRAIGETMIVVMAAGLIATVTLNPFESVTTVTVQIVSLLIGDAEFDNPKTLAAFALGLTLFLITLGLNLIALRTVRKYREKY